MSDLWIEIPNAKYALRPQNDSFDWKEFRLRYLQSKVQKSCLR